MTDDKVEDFIDIDKFNAEVEKIKKEKVFEKPIKEYDVNAYRKIVDKILDQMHAPPAIKDGVLNGMMEMLKATKIFDLISPDEFERVINSMIRPDKKVNDPAFLTGMLNDNPFGGSNPLDMLGKAGMIMPPPDDLRNQIGQALMGKIFGGPQESETLKLSGKFRDSQISFEITDMFTCNMALDILNEFKNDMMLKTQKKAFKDADNS